MIRVTTLLWYIAVLLPFTLVVCDVTTGAEYWWTVGALNVGFWIGSIRMGTKL